ncbi:glycosyltransferase [Acinetobacter ursingii]|uniref:glycosyltransferase n=1 Tax=Acinetobacter ursingii TaxID=108980 RepID=UPI0030081AE5
MDFTIVIPIDLNYRSLDIIKKIIVLKNKVKDEDFKVILSCNSNPRLPIQILKKIIEKTTNICLINIGTEKGNLSKLRNNGIKHTKTKYILFLDIDIYIDIPQIKNTFYVFQQASTDLCMYPCLYLSKQGTKKISKLSIKQFRQAYYGFRRDLILHLAFPSSIILTDLKSVQAIEGFDEQFIGHGYEDFDFLLRLFHYKGLIQYQPSLLIDETYLAPMMATGFRAILAESQLEQLLLEEYFLHMYHKKDKKSLFHQQRKINQERFKMKLKQKLEIDNKEIDTTPPYLLKAFFQLLARHQLNRPEYATLWAEIHGYKLRK